MKRNAFFIALGCLMGVIVFTIMVQIFMPGTQYFERLTPNGYLFSLIVLLLLTLALIKEIMKERSEFTLLDKIHKKTEESLHEQMKRFETIFEHTAMVVALLNLDGRLFRANQATAVLLGYDETELLLLNYFHLMPQQVVTELKTNMQAMIDGKIHKYELEHECIKKNNEALWVKSTLTLIRNHSNEPLYFILQMQNISLQKKAEDRLRHMAYHDPLTGLANRNKLEQFINHLIASSRRRQQNFAVIFLDLDRFKTINDTIGHEAGDLLLQIVAERLRRSVRNTDMVARLGGDEFVLLITEIVQVESVANIAQKILETILRVIVVQGHEIYITTSIGISLYPFDGHTMQNLMKHADLAMYRAKEHGRNNFQFYTQEMTIRAQEKLSLQNALSHAFVKKEFLLHYQPIKRVDDGEVSSVEALLRWKNEKYGNITPNEIIALAEETGLIIPVSEWILETACQQLKSWHDMGFTSLTMSINCSPRQFKQVAFVNNILETVTESGLALNSLQVEVTESLIMRDPENSLRILYALKDIGVKIVIDNFGTGYWSLSNLRRMSVDKIKIDRSFVKQVTLDETSAIIVRAIIAMVNKLGVTSVATGVETREQYEFLVKEGCSEIQGYYIATTMNEEKMTKFLKESVTEENESF